MAITYDPKKLLKRVAPERKVERLITSKVGLKRTALAFVDDVEFLDKAAVAEVALKTIRGYQMRIAKAQAEKMEKSAGDEIEEEILDDPRQLIQRVQNEVVIQVADKIRTNYQGEQYEWLPSDAEEPDPEHQLKYGEIFTIGVGEMPGDRYGCRCGMRILVPETQLDLE